MIEPLEEVPNFAPGMNRENEVRAKINELVQAVNNLLGWAGIEGELTRDSLIEILRPHIKPSAKVDALIDEIFDEAKDAPVDLPDGMSP